MRDFSSGGDGYDINFEGVAFVVMYNPMNPGLQCYIKMAPTPPTAVASGQKVCTD